MHEIRQAVSLGLGDFAEWFFGPYIAPVVGADSGPAEASASGWRAALDTGINVGGLHFSCREISWFEPPLGIAGFDYQCTTTAQAQGLVNALSARKKVAVLGSTGSGWYEPGAAAPSVTGRPPEENVAEQIRRNIDARGDTGSSVLKWIGIGGGVLVAAGLAVYLAKRKR